MSEVVQRYPLEWPSGWRRIPSSQRKRAQFNRYRKQLSVFDGLGRMASELEKLGVGSNDWVCSTNIPTRMDGMPRSDRAEPEDPGVAVYWLKGKERRCMAVDRYDRVADNIAAIAATIEAMRAIERHGGAQILDRAFIGFKALPMPEQWWQVLGLKGPVVTEKRIKEAHERLAWKHHPDRGGTDWEMARINAARDTGLEEIRVHA